MYFSSPIDPVLTSSSTNESMNSATTSAATAATELSVAASCSSEAVTASGKCKTMSIGVQTDVIISGSINLSVPLWFSSLVPFNPSTQIGSTAVGAYSTAVRESLSSSPPQPSRIPFPLYRDVLQVVFRYVSLHDLPTVIRLSKQWYQSFNLSSPLDIVTHMREKWLARIPPNSAVARHIVEASKIRDAVHLSRDLAFPGFSILPHLAVLLPNLTTLSIDTESFFDLPLPGKSWLPPLLKKIAVGMGRADQCPSLFSAIGQLRMLTDLSLCLIPLPEEMLGVDFSPLLPLAPAQLQRFSLFSSPNWSDLNSVPSLVHFVRQTRVSKLVVPNVTSQSNRIVSQLMDPEPTEITFPLMDSGNLTYIDSPLNRETLQSIARFPTLTKLVSSHADLDEMDMKFLARLSQLTSLTLSQEFQIHPPRTANMIVSACAFLPNLRCLSIERLEFDTKQMDECLAQLPCLTDLNMQGSVHSTSLAPLVRYGLPDRLIKLSLQRFFAPISDLTDFILQLQQLESLRLDEVCTTVIPDKVKTQLRGMPNLKECVLIHGVPQPYHSDDVKNKINSDEEMDEYVPDLTQKGTRASRFYVWTEEQIARDYYTCRYEATNECYHNITAMKEYRHKSQEELRLEDEEIGLENLPEFSQSEPGEKNATASAAPPITRKPAVESIGRIPYQSQERYLR